MASDDQARLDRRLLMLPATLRDGATARGVLGRAGVDTEVCASVGAMVAEL